MAPVGPPVRIRGLLGVVSTLLLGSGHTPGHPVPRVTSAWTTDRRGLSEASRGDGAHEVKTEWPLCS
jgi:hypothetical protein